MMFFLFNYYYQHGEHAAEMGVFLFSLFQFFLLLFFLLRGEKCILWKKIMFSWQLEIFLLNSQKHKNNLWKSRAHESSTTILFFFCSCAMLSYPLKFLTVILFYWAEDSHDLHKLYFFLFGVDSFVKNNYENKVIFVS